MQKSISESNLVCKLSQIFDLQEIGITASADNTVRVWSIPNSACAYTIKVSTFIFA